MYFILERVFILIKKILISAWIIVSLTTAMAYASDNPIKPQVGNTSGNLSNDGIYASQGEWIYYRSFSDGLYKVKKDGTDKTKISDGWPSYLNVVGDYFYYSDYIGQGLKLVKQKMDGTDKQILAHSSYYIHVVDDYIYYTAGNSSDGRIYKMKTDGTEKVKLSNDPVNQIVVVDNWIYYTVHGHKLFKMDINGDSRTKLLAGQSIGQLNVEGEWLFFNLNKGIYKMKKDGSQLTKLSDDRARHMNVSNGWIYYSHLSGKQNLVRIKTDGTQREVLNQIKSHHISVIDNSVFFYDSYKIVKLDLDEVETSTQEEQAD